MHYITAQQAATQCITLQQTATTPVLSDAPQHG